jgi:ABC-type spermidine/putrescine transport system permease subunit I
MTAQAGGPVTGPPAEAHAGSRGSTLGRIWPFGPAAAVLLVLFFIPLAIVFVYSFWTVQNLQLIPTWTLQNYLKFFQTDTYIRTFLKTVIMAVLVTAAGIGMAFPFAYFLARYVSPRWQRIMLLAVIIPFWSSYLVRVYAWQAILGEKGALNWLLMQLGITSEPLTIFLYNDVGVFIVLTYVYFPFAALSLYSSLEKFDFTQLTAAQDLGATPLRAMRRILIPQVRPGFITAMIFVFIPIIGEYLTPTLVGGTKGVLIGNLIVNFYRGGAFPAMAAAAFIIAAFILLLLVAFRRYLQLDDVVTKL